MTTDEVLSKSKEGFQKALEHLKEEYKRLQVGRASTALVDNIMVEMYGVLQPMKALANLAILDAKSLSIQPWDKKALVPIEKAIANSGLGLNPINNGISLIINIPPLTEERRADIAKHVKSLEEEARISVRNVRQEAVTAFKKMKDGKEITEDDYFDAEKRLQEGVEAMNKQIEEAAKAKAADVMTL
jgi:ribosome recycling factor